MVFLALLKLSSLDKAVNFPDRYMVNAHISGVDSTISVLYLDKTDNYEMAKHLVEFFSRDFSSSSESFCYTYTVTDIESGKVDTLKSTCNR